MHEDPLKKVDLKEASNASLLSTIEIVKVLIAVYSLQINGFPDSEIADDGNSCDITWGANRRRYLKYKKMVENLSRREEAVLGEMKRRGLI